MGHSVWAPWHSVFPQQTLGPELVTQGLSLQIGTTIHVSPSLYWCCTLNLFFSRLLLGRLPLLFYSLQYTFFHPSGAHHVTQPHNWSALSSQHLPSNCPGLFAHNWEINVNASGWWRYTQVVSPETGKKSEHSVHLRVQPVLLCTDSPQTVSIQTMPKAKRLPCKTTGLCLWDFFMHYHFHLAAVGYKINVYINTAVESKRLFWRDVGIVL